MERRENNTQITQRDAWERMGRLETWRGADEADRENQEGCIIDGRQQNTGNEKRPCDEKTRSRRVTRGARIGDTSAGPT